MLSVVRCKAESNVDSEESQLLAEILQKCKEVARGQGSLSVSKPVAVNFEHSSQINDPVAVEETKVEETKVEETKVEETKVEEAVEVNLEVKVNESQIGVAIGLIAKARSEKAKEITNPAKPPLPQQRPPDLVTLSGVGSFHIVSSKVSECNTMLKPKPQSFPAIPNKGLTKSESDDAKALLMVRWHSQDFGPADQDEVTEVTENESVGIRYLQRIQRGRIAQFDPGF